MPVRKPSFALGLNVEPDGAAIPCAARLAWFSASLMGVVAASMIVPDNPLVSLGAGVMLALVLLSLTNRNEF